MNLKYHVGFVVPQLEEAMAAYGRALGVDRPQTRSILTANYFSHLEGANDGSYL